MGTASPAALVVEDEPKPESAPEPRAELPGPEDLLGRAPNDPLVLAFLDGAEIEQSSFAEGTRYLSAKAEGFELHIEAGSIGTVFLHGEGHQGFVAYPDPQFAGIAFGDSSERALELLGPADAQGEGWLKWYRPTWSLHLEFDSGGLRMITLMTVEADPNR